MKHRRRSYVTQTFAADLSVGETDVPFRRWVHTVPFGSQTLADRDEVFEFDGAAAKRVVAIWEQHKAHDRRTIFDWGHGSYFDAPPESAGKSGTVLGWEIRADGLWALGEFTERAAALIRSGDFDQVSPEIHGKVKNLETDEWEEGPGIFAIALTARPALAGLDVLAASQRWEAFGARFGLTDAEAVSGKVHRAVDAAALAGSLGSVDIEDGMQWTVRVEEIDPDWHSVVAHNRKTGQWFALGLGEFEGALVIDSIEEVERSFTPKQGEPGDDTMSLTAEQTALLDAIGDRTPEDLTRLFGLADAVGDLDAETLTGRLAVADAAGDKTVDEVMAFATAPASAGGDSEAVTLLRSEIAGRDQRIDALEAHVKAGADEKADRDAADAVSKFEGTGQITPAMRPECLKMAKADPVAFAAFASILPVSVPLPEVGTAGAPDTSSQPETLHSLTEAKVAEMSTVTGESRGAGELYAIAYSQVRAERPDLYRAHYDTPPAGRVVQIHA